MLNKAKHSLEGCDTVFPHGPYGTLEAFLSSPKSVMGTESTSSSSATYEASHQLSTAAYTCLHTIGGP